MNFNETESIEFKRTLNDKFEKEVVAFLNSVGGKIIIGIDDNGNVVGVDNVDKTALLIADKIKNNISPSAIGLFNIAIKEENEKSYVVVTVAGGLEKPYHLKNTVCQQTAAL